MFESMINYESSTFLGGEGLLSHTGEGFECFLEDQLPSLSDTSEPLEEPDMLAAAVASLSDSPPSSPSDSSPLADLISPSSAEDLLRSPIPEPVPVETSRKRKYAEVEKPTQEGNKKRARSKAPSSPFEPTTSVGLDRDALLKMSSVELDEYVQRVTMERGSLSEEEKEDVRRMVKLVKNRENAASSRAKRRGHVAALEAKVSTLETEKETLTAKIASFESLLSATAAGRDILVKVFSMHGEKSSASAAGTCLLLFFGFGLLFSMVIQDASYGPTSSAFASIAASPTQSLLVGRDLQGLSQSLHSLSSMYRPSDTLAPERCHALDPLRPYLNQSLPSLLYILDQNPACKWLNPANTV